MENIVFQPIGIIYSAYTEPRGTPIQPASAKGKKGRVELFPQFEDGLLDIEGFSHLILIYYFHRSEGFQLQVKPFLDENKHGVFSTRAPFRPNPVGVSVVKLVNRNKNILEIENVDILDGTPLLDIKPYIPDFEATEQIATGWLTNSKHKINNAVNDGRFEL
ncbi:MAG: tRNA (N6-threonylcarbamoyladenosine(37)-N6)-methyltransferase TrmO [Prolixibacteraceae bacterium]|nr:tRNA (N6-threonylcarbamoyladenosine(37)-N6)-methyltransferase TrmO [Prolixibacteraceae bacterium]